MIIDKNLPTMQSSAMLIRNWRILCRLELFLFLIIVLRGDIYPRRWSMDIGVLGQGGSGENNSMGWQNL